MIVTELTETPLLPTGFKIPTTRYLHPSVRMRQLLDTEPYLFGPGVYDPFGAQLAMYYGFKAVYLSGYSFAIGHLGTTDMDMYASVEIADAARRTVIALRKFQLTMSVGDPEKGVPPRHLDIPPLIVDMDGGYGNIFNVQRTTELYVTAGVAAAHIEDQVMPKRCGHIGGKALIPVNEMVGKLRMARAVADDLGNPDLLWCEFPTSDRGAVETFSEQIKKRFPDARFAFNWSSSFKWFQEPNPMTFAELGEMGVKFIFITLGAQHAEGYGLSVLLQAMSKDQQDGYIALQRKEFESGQDFPTKSHHFFSGVPYHHLVGKAYDAARLGQEFVEALPEDRVV